MEDSPEVSEEDSEADMASDDGEDVVAGFEDDDSDEEDGENHSLAGVIERVTLVNFLCHKHLEVDFGPNVNFITGANGSGKSAILSALHVCLGGKASFTGRGSSLSSFVRRGANRAVVTVRLSNRGRDAFEPDKFGRSIVVQRTIGTAGGGYLIKDSRGRKVSDKREMLVRILDAFQISVSNECVVLMQETSKRFLFTVRAQDKYELFMRATELEAIRASFERAEESVETAVKIVERKNGQLAPLSARVKSLKEELRMLDEVSKLQDELTLAGRRLAWAHHDAAERDVRRAEEEAAAGKEDHERQLKALRDVRDAEGELSREAARLNEERMSALDLTRAADTRFREADGRIADITRRNQRALQELAREREKREKVEKRIRDVEEEIEKMEKQGCGEYEREIAARRKEVERMQHEVERRQGSVDELAGKLRLAGERRDELQRRATDAKAEVASKRRDVEAAQQGIERLKNMAKSRSSAFGRRFPEFLAAVQQHRQWRGAYAPIGPIGLELQVEDEANGEVIEAFLKNQIDSFVIGHSDDRRTLMEIGRRFGLQRVNVILFTQSSGSIYAMPQSQLPHDRLPTVLKAVRCRHPQVINALIDTGNIERVVICERFNDAADLIDPSKGGSNVLNVIDKERLYRHTLRNGTFMQMALNRHAVNGVLGADTSRGLQAAQQRLAQLGPAVQRAMAEVKDAERAYQEAAAMVTSLQAALTRAQRELGAAANGLEVARKDLQSVRPPESGIDELRATKERFEATAATIEETLARLEGQGGEMLDELRPLEDARSAAQAEQEELVERSRGLHEELVKVRKRLQGLEADKARAEARERRARERLEGLDPKAAAARAEHERVLKAARDFSSDRPEGKLLSASSYKNEMKQIEERIALERDLGRRDPRVVRKEYKREAHRVREIREQMAEVTDFIEAMKKSIAVRRRSWREMRQSISKRVNHWFARLLAERNFGGMLHFDHKAGALEMSVSTDASSHTLAASAPTQSASDHAPAASQASSTSTLSGGERSFTTVALLVSLWNCIEAPWVAGDELDVFQDSVSRNFTMKFLLNVAAKKKKHQFIYISPLSVEGDDEWMRDDNINVKVIQLDPPERNNID